MKKHFYLLFAATLVASSIYAQVITVSTFTPGLSRPVCIANTGMPNDDRIFVIEKIGRIRMVNRVTGALNPNNFLSIQGMVATGNEQGLLGMAFHPDYANNGYFFVDYTNNAGHTVIARYQVSSNPDSAIASSAQILMTIYQPAANHNGGNLMFGWDGYLYINMGDGGPQGDPGNRAQHIDTLLGKILRIDVNNPNPPYYSSAPTNQFYGATPGRDEIFAVGFRNPWRASIDRMTGDKWIGDVGQNLWEEVSFESRCDSMGRNYGWRCYEGNAPYNTSGCQPQSYYVSPVFAYSHLVSGNCSVTGGYVYRGGQEGALFGKYIFADYCSGIIWATSPNGSGGWNTVQLTQTNSINTNSYTSFGEDIYGELYVARDGASGNISRITDTACAPTAYINSPDTIINCTGSAMTFNAIYGTGLTYQWYRDGVAVGITQTYNLAPVSSTVLYVAVTNANCTAISDSIHIFTDATFLGLDSLYCDTAPSVPLIGIPAGGTFSGPGISGNMFDPNAAGIGVHIITYTLADTVSSCYYTASGCILADTQYVTVDICTGIEEQNDFRGVSVYPNPNHAEFNVEFTLLQSTEFTLLVADALGRNVYEKNIEAQKGKHNMAVNLPGASEGVYFLFMKTENESRVNKIIVQR